MSLEKKFKKLVLILATFTPVTRTRKKAVETTETVKTAEAVKTSKIAKTAKTIETVGAGKNSEESKSGENSRFNIAQVSCIQYSINFRKKSILVLFDLSGEVNTLNLTFAQELGLLIKLTDVEAQKIDCIRMDTYEIVVRVFLVTNKANQVRFFEKIILVANVSLVVVFRRSFLTLSSTNVDFLGQESS